MKSRFLLDVVVGESTAVFELFSSEDESLLVGRDTKTAKVTFCERSYQLSISYPSLS